MASQENMNTDAKYIMSFPTPIIQLWFSDTNCVLQLDPIVTLLRVIIRLQIEGLSPTRLPSLQMWITGTGAPGYMTSVWLNYRFKSTHNLLWL